MPAAMSSGCSAMCRPLRAGHRGIDGHPATLAWLGSVHGHRTRSLGVEHFGQTGTIADLYRHFGIDTAGILRTGQRIAAWANMLLADHGIFRLIYLNLPMQGDADLWRAAQPAPTRSPASPGRA
jgi:hypothetical protein